ncbi:MAG: tetratricopeptide repeat protein [Puniceicoccaceae bacterium]|nr:MAG: tetratricopeptide repeat protein [Puniceicoccaceae bacterium]
MVAVFFLGLAAGSWIFGCYAGRLRRPLLVFAGLEIALGLYALLSFVWFDWADAVYGGIYRAWPEATLLLGAARTLLVGLVILPATVVMGATLPLYCRWRDADPAGRIRSVGWLYGLNTLGAACGAALAGFVLLPLLGMAAGLAVAALVSLVSGVLVLLLPLARFSREQTVMSASLEVLGSGDPRVALWLYGVAGFAALGLQVVWLRFLSLILRNTVTTYTLVLTVVLAGIVLGSWLAAALVRREWHPGRAFAVLQVATGCLVGLLLALPAGFWQAASGAWWVYALLLLPPSVLGGASFPLAAALAAGTAARGAGSAAAANTLGGVAGVLATGFAIIPLAGLRMAVLLLTLVMVGVGAAAWLYWNRGVSRSWWRAGAGAVAALAAWAAVVLPEWTRVPEDFLVEGAGRLLGHREGFGANLAVVEEAGVRRLEIDRWWQGEDRRNHQSVSAHIPALLHPEPRSVLLIGAGTGQTAARFLMHGVERLDCVDIEPVIFDFVGQFFEADWMRDPRTRLIVEDGRTYLRHASERYDIVSMELGQIFRPGVAYFYTREAYAYARERLNPGGLVVQFMPLPFFTLESLRAAVGTFLEEFPEASLWFNTSEVLLIGSPETSFPWERPRGPGPETAPEIMEDLRYAHWGGLRRTLDRPEVFRAGLLLGPAELVRFAGGAVGLRDNRPLLDQVSARIDPMDSDEVRIVEALRAELRAGGEDGETGRIRERNLGDIAATALLRRAVQADRRGDAAAALVDLVEAARWNPENGEVQLRLGDLLLRQGDVTGALDPFREAERYLIDDFQAPRGVALCLHRLGRVEEALRFYRRALALAPEVAELHNNFGAALAERGRHGEARRHFREAVRLDPDHGDARRNLDRIDALLGP